MEAEYIGIETVIKSLEKLCDRVCQYSKAQRYVMCSSCPLGDAFTVIEDDITPADVRPVVRGRWEWNEDDGHYYCTVCGSVSPESDQNGDECDCPNFCPNCGSYNGGDADGNTQD